MANSTQHSRDKSMAVKPKKKQTAIVIIALLILSLSLILVALFLPEIQLRNFISKLRDEGVTVHVIKGSPEWLEYVSGGQITMKTSVVGLHFGQYPATDKTIKSILNWSTLQSLSMQKVDVSEQAIAELFANCPDLITLQILSCPKIGPAFVQKLRTKYPRLTINYRGVAYLGVSAFSQNPGGEQFCQINYVQPGMPAHQAGLVRGDIITTFAGNPITTFDDLVHNIGKKQPGDVVAITVLRGGTKEFKYQCTLTGWAGRLP